MTKGRFAPVLLSLLWPGLAAAQTTTHTVFVTGDSKVLQVVVNVNEATKTVSGTPTVSNLKLKGNCPITAPREIAFGPDGRLYVVSGNQIVTIKQDGGDCKTFFIATSSTHPTNLGGIRFLGNTLYFTGFADTNTNGQGDAGEPSGVFRINLSSPTSIQQVASRTLTQPGGIFFNLVGQLLFLDSAATGQLFRVNPTPGMNPPFPGQNAPFGASCSSCNAAQNITPGGGLSSPISIGTRGSNGFPATNTTFVTAGQNIKVLTCASGPCDDSPPVIPFASDSPRDLEFNLSGRGFVATLGTVAKLWRVDPFDTVQMIQLVDFSTEKGPTAIRSIWGVALPPTSQKLVTSTPYTGLVTQSQRFNCGNSLVDLSFNPMGQSVTATIDCQLRLPGEVNPSFGGDATGALCASYDWNNGFCTLMDVQLSPNINVSKSLLVTYVRKAEPLAANPLLISDFNNVTILDYYLLGELDPEDQSRRGGASVAVIADRPIADAAANPVFRPKLGTSCQNAEILQGQSSLSIRVDFDQFCDPAETLRLSVRCNADTPSNFQDIVVTSVGNANFENFFRCDLASGGWVYNLDLSGSNVPVGPCCAASVWGDVGAAAQGFFRRQ